MTSEAFKTNEFLRRRKLRIQQVREQSKDIAKRIRQRAQVEKLKQFDDLDEKRRQDYLQKQELLINKLEELYSKGVESVGTGHKSAHEIKEQDISAQKLDLSKKRGKEAAAELKKKRQEKLDEQKKILDKRLQAREAANELSREKSASLANKTKKQIPEDTVNKSPPEKDGDKNADNNEKPVVTQNDMATQWDFEQIPNEWEPNVPGLTLPKDDKESAKETNNNTERKSDKNKRIDLFALSDEMPSSLRGGLTNEERIPIKPSLTLVSEYLQSRGMRLRDTAVTASSKKHEDLRSLKQTIQRTRTSKTEVSEKSSNFDKSVKSSIQGSALAKKNSVTQYNHSTRDTRDLPYGMDKIVTRNSQDTEDAYSQAIKESTLETAKENEPAKKLQEMRSKVAMTKQNVEKEYKDTMSFLNSLPKEKPNKRVTTAFMDEHRHQMQKENRQQKMQQEFRKIEKECRKHSCTKKIHNKSKSPKRTNTDFNKQDFQYSWMPVPESDASLAIHTVPTNVRESKSGNMVKFSTVDSYHEYRSRHKHTPPTKDIGSQEKRDKRIEAVIIQDNTDSIDSSRSSSSESSIENTILQKDKNLSDAERIIVYKILDSKINKKTKKAKLVRNIGKSLTSVDKGKENTVEQEQNRASKTIPKDDNNSVAFEEVREGVYKTVNEKGKSYNVLSCYTTNVEMWQTKANPKPWWDNMTSMYFSDKPSDNVELVVTEELKYDRTCGCNKKDLQDKQSDKGGFSSRENVVTSERPKCACASTSKQDNNISSVIHPSAATSTTSFKTATNNRTHNALTDEGYIKLIEDGGHGSGKLYIGASGFLKNDAYEVVIQLRKKDEGKDDKVDKKVLVSDAVPETKSAEVITDSNSVTAAEVQVTPLNQSKDDVRTEIIRELPSNDDNSKEPAEQILNEANVELSSSDSNVSITTKKSENRTKYTNTGHTPSQISVATQNNVLQFDSLPRPATSTYTQTSFSSPNHRPIFFHMSSSTSTAYMSPPEMVLPKFLRQDYRITDEEIYESIHNSNSQDKIKLAEQEYAEDYDRCGCKRCLHAKRVTVYKVRDSLKKKYNTSKIQTPPNTTRSCAKSCTHNRNTLKTLNTGNSNKTEYKHRKCENKTLLNASADINADNKRPPTCKKSSRSKIRPTSSAATTHRSRSNPPTCNVQNIALNPVIKTYVDKLLALNKEGLKAVEVVDQDCSSLATPGSSIINVSSNFNGKKMHLEEKISLEQIKNMLKKQIIEEIAKENKIEYEAVHTVSLNTIEPKNVQVPRLPIKKPVHKVKSLNISKHLLKSKNSKSKRIIPKVNVSSISSNKNLDSKYIPNVLPMSKTRNMTSPTSRKFDYSHLVARKVGSDTDTERNAEQSKVSNINILESSTIQHKTEVQKPCRKVKSRLTTASRTSVTDIPLEPKLDNAYDKCQYKKDFPTNTATQTKENMDSDTNLIKVAEDKLQNMEKIADLTEKCTQRLSNLAKILEQVRKNKSLVYGHISASDSASDSDQKSEKNTIDNRTPVNMPSLNTHLDTDKKSEIKSQLSVSTIENDAPSGPTDFVPLLNDIPKPFSFSSSNFTEQLSPLSSIHVENVSVKNRGRPPPALSRIHLKNGHELVVPHELSTVLEVDSPMSVKLKNQSTRGKNSDIAGGSYVNIAENVKDKSIVIEKANNTDSSANPDLLPVGSNLANQPTRLSFSDTSDDSKLQMMDLKQFNDIMLKPFISFKEHAKQCNIVEIDDCSNLGDNPKDKATNDDISSLHSDGSLPDVIAELLKRNIISEPFKYDTASNANSTTASSESSLSILALSKMRKEKRKSTNVMNNKENIVESSDTLSMSSNPDLEKAFKKLGMGWASSTLKKTKERLALSSSSNTSSSSLSQFKLKGFENFEIPALVTDSLSTVLDISKKHGRFRQATELSKNAEQQTSKTNSMTVKDFLNNELAKKITFTTQSRRDDTDEEFVSLAETKMPEQMKHLVQTIPEEGTFDSVPSVKENRARTSTPVQLFKSTTYHSSSSSNMSNGLFSNADDLSSVKVTSNSVKNHSTSEKDDLAVPNFSLRKKKSLSDCSKSD